jgi:hypothetical protein
VCMNTSSIVFNCRYMYYNIMNNYFQFIRKKKMSILIV